TSEALISGMRQWIIAPNLRSGLSEQRETLQAEIAKQTAALREQVAAVKKSKAEPREDFNAARAFGGELSELQQSLGRALPVTAADIQAAAAKDEAVVEAMNRWIATAREAKAIRDELTAPQRLQAMMDANGV